MAFMAAVEKITIYLPEEHDWVISKWENMTRPVLEVKTRLGFLMIQETFTFFECSQVN